MTQPDTSLRRRKILWFFAFLIVLPAWVYGLRNGVLGLALAGLPVFVILMVMSLNKRACPSCRKKIRTIGTKLSRCPHCGVGYESES